MWYILGMLVLAVGVVRIIYNRKSGRCCSEKRLDGKTVIVTGASAGIGKETALDLAERGARVILACRNLEKAQKVADEIVQTSGNTNIEVRELDTSKLSSVRQFANEILKTELRLDILVNNAGMPGHCRRVLTSDGLELTMATNHYGHFLLTNILLSVVANCLHPGVVYTEITSKIGGLSGYIQNILFYLMAKDSKLGAQTTIHVAVSDEADSVSGKYFVDCKEATCSKLASHRGMSKKLWLASELDVKLEPEESLFYSQ